VSYTTFENQGGFAGFKLVLVEHNDTRRYTCTSQLRFLPVASNSREEKQGCC
jgi:hypothetical protein